MKCKVIVFPGSNCDYDCFYIIDKIFAINVEYVWHKNPTIGPCDFIILPGGFSYGDYLRCGAIARFSPIMNDIIKFAKKGNPILGICNGFQILLETGLLPGALLRNNSLKFICEHVYLKTNFYDTFFTNAIEKDKPLSIPIAHGEGNYFCDRDIIKKLQDNNQIIFQYCNASGEVTNDSNPNGSINNIAGIVNKKRNILGMMPHPERASEKIIGTDDGKAIFQSVINKLL